MAGLPIVFVPGLLCTGRIYEHQAQQLGRRHPVLLANHWSHTSMAEIAKSILTIAPEKFALAGASMGGYVAFEIMRQAPDRVAKLILLSTSARPDTPERSEGRRKQVAAVREHGARTGVKALWPNLVHPARQEDHALLAVFNEMADELGPDAFARQVDAIIGRADSRPDLPKIKVPTLVIAGAEDKLIPPDNSKEIADGIPGARLELVDHCGHMGMIERPETYTRLLGEFVA
ncbi:MAG TPA: alpha/beta fold hydrolase [Hyphomonadaceae bacterium]|nr:alpha/beta fold hydrolase [Hyphomonadaceae bacterium]